MPDIHLYAISTCIYCKNTVKLLNEHNIKYELTYVDLLDKIERERVLDEVMKYNSHLTFPTLVIDNKVIIGYDKERILNAIKDLQKQPSREEAINQLYESLKKTQEPKGFFFNKDSDTTLNLLDSLLVNKERYGYMSCPCRLASGDREKDKDIICPCRYREDDVKEYGRCYCGLYVSKEWNEDKIPHIDQIPERRPAERVT